MRWLRSGTFSQNAECSEQWGIQWRWKHFTKAKHLLAQSGRCLNIEFHSYSRPCPSRRLFTMMSIIADGIEYNQDQILNGCDLWRSGHQVLTVFSVSSHSLSSYCAAKFCDIAILALFEIWQKPSRNHLKTSQCPSNKRAKPHHCQNRTSQFKPSPLKTFLCWIRTSLFSTINALLIYKIIFLSSEPKIATQKKTHQIYI